MRPGIKPFMPPAPWRNVHENFAHNFTGISWHLDHVGTGISEVELYLRATENLQWAIGQAIENRQTLRALGSNWSFSSVAMCSGGMVQTKGLDLIFNIKREHVSPIFTNTGKTPAALKLVECGVQIARLNKLLEIESNPARCIRASGGSNGQTIAGATATGTHGAALYSGAVHDAIVGIHLITGPNSHVWLERASYPVASDALITRLGATLMRDDALFNAALVSFGSFGIIHGIMLETEPLFLLKEYRISGMVYTDDLIDSFAALNIAKLKTLLPGMPDSVPGHELYHMEINLNPYTVVKDGNEGMYVFLFYKVPVPPGHVVNHGGGYDPAPSPEFIWIMKNLLTALGGNFSYDHVKRATTREFEANIRPATPTPKSIGAIFRDTRFTGNIASFALAVATSSLAQTLEEILAEIKVNAFAGAVAIRFVKGTKATLGFTKFDNTCVVEMDGLDTKSNHQVFANVVNRLTAKGIPHTIHWGKLNGPLNANNMKRMYSPNKVQAWKQARERLLTPEVRSVFTNPFMTKCGLDTPVGFPV
ncbi:FAD-binding oxidoreductase [Adhaeribacter soli]|uniref:FAD-linked oxidase n=1 Tax=Adhaeribacter soli TaxID=2607655 RepID=A0A5N1IWW7_9BACT|nr:FAD-linked oxidase [Adhaeribacter soli]KAA9338784.1 FAD-linked oxidase [Adhaeribacter soli]